MISTCFQLLYANISTNTTLSQVFCAIICQIATYIVYILYGCIQGRDSQTGSVDAPESQTESVDSYKANRDPSTPPELNGIRRRLQS